MEEAQRRIYEWISNDDETATLKLEYLGLTSLPDLPQSVQKLDCWNNNLTSLPTLPRGLQELRYDSKKIKFVLGEPHKRFPVLSYISNEEYNRLQLIYIKAYKNSLLRKVQEKYLVDEITKYITVPDEFIIKNI